MIELCYKFVHKGAAAYCLKSNWKIEECLDLAGENAYLKRICNLREDETIPTEGFYDPKYQADPIPYVTYSELI